MAQFSHLPLYVQTYEFVKIIYRLTQQFSKEYKYSLGLEMQKIIWEILDKIIEANSLSNTEKGQKIMEISLLFDQFKIRCRLAYEIGLVPEKKFIFIHKQLEEIGRMIGGWKKWAK